MSWLMANRPAFASDSGAASAETVALPDDDDRHVLVAAVAADTDVLCTDNIKRFLEQVMAEVGIAVMTAGAQLANLVREFATVMLTAHRRTVLSPAGATDESTVAALRRANAARTAD